MNDKVSVDGDNFRVILHREKNESGSRTIDVCTSKNGGVTVGGYDLGPAVENLLGHDDYEYDATVAAEDKHALYTALKRDLFEDKDNLSPGLQIMTLLMQKQILI